MPRWRGGNRQWGRWVCGFWKPAGVDTMVLADFWGFIFEARVGVVTDF